MGAVDFVPTRIPSPLDPEGMGTVDFVTAKIPSLPDPDGTERVNFMPDRILSMDSLGFFSLPKYMPVSRLAVLWLLTLAVNVCVYVAMKWIGVLSVVYYDLIPIIFVPRVPRICLDTSYPSIYALVPN